MQKKRRSLRKGGREVARVREGTAVRQKCGKNRIVVTEME